MNMYYQAKRSRMPFVVLLLTIFTTLFLSAMYAAPGFAEEPESGDSDEMVATMVGNYFELPGEISFKFIVSVPKGMGDGVTGEIICMDKSVKVAPDVYDDEGSETVLEFSYGVMLPSIREEISLTLYDAGGQRIPFYHGSTEFKDDTVVCTVYDVLKNCEKSDESILELASTMRNFCERARRNFGVHSEIPCDEDVVVIFKSLLEPYAVKKEELPDGIEYAGTAISFDNMSLRVYFYVDEDVDLGLFDVRVDGEPVELEQYKDNIYMTKIPSFPAELYGEGHTVTVNGAEISNISLLTQVYNIVNDDDYDQKGREMYMSLYYFSQAAKAYYND